MLRRTFPARIHSYWGGYGWPKDKPFLSLFFGQNALRSYKNTHFVDVKEVDPTLPPLSPQGSYLLSALRYDLDLLGRVDWTAEFDPFWYDQLKTHEKLYDVLYTPNGGRFRKFLIGGDRSGEKYEVERKLMAKTLNEFRSMLQWARETEGVYSAIYNARFTMQREVWDALEREKLLLGCAEAYTDLVERIPADYHSKASKELSWHLTTMRHWVWDCPNAKRVYNRLLA